MGNIPHPCGRNKQRNYVTIMQSAGFLCRRVIRRVSQIASEYELARTHARDVRVHVTCKVRRVEVP